jgi:diamine N-acetyltransferase
MKFRKIEKEDLYFLNDVRNIYAEDFLHDSRKFSIEETTEWFFRESPDYYMIEIGEERVGYFRIGNHSRENKSIYIGADIHPNFTGEGLGYLSYKKFIPFIFEEYDLNKISLEVLSNNHRAIHLYEKIGFIREGVKREEILRGGIYLDSIIMSILKRECK